MSLSRFRGEILINVKSEFFTQGGVLLYTILIELNKSGVQKLDTYQSQSEYMKDLVYLKDYVGKQLVFEEENAQEHSFDLSQMRMA